MKGRSLKDQGYTKFKVIEHSRSHRTAEIKVHKRDGTFGCEIGDMRKVGELRDVESWANGMLKQKDTTRFDWLPVIRARVEGTEHWYRGRRKDENDDRSVKVQINAERFYIARASRDPEGREVWRSLSWQKADADSPEKIPDADMAEYAQKFREPKEPSQFGRDESPAEIKGWVRLPEVRDGHYLIQYNEELWQGIQHVIDVIENEEKILDKLFSTVAGRETLAKLGSQPELLRLTAGG